MHICVHVYVGMLACVLCFINQELTNIVNELSNRLALCDTTSNGDVDKKMDELTRVYQLLSTTEGRLNNAEAEATHTNQDLEEANARLKVETTTTQQLRESLTECQQTVDALKGQLKEAQLSHQYVVVQDLKKQLQEQEKQHQSAMQRQNEALQESEAKWRREQVRG